jgi:hypothetical protein
VFQSKEKEERSKTFFQVQDEAALNEEFEQLKNAHSDRYCLLRWTSLQIIDKF